MSPLALEKGRSVPAPPRRRDLNPLPLSAAVTREKRKGFARHDGSPESPSFRDRITPRTSPAMPKMKIRFSRNDSPGNKV